MKISIEEILGYLKEEDLGFEIKGNRDIFISGYSSIKNIKNNNISWVKNQSFYSNIPSYLEQSIIIVSKDISIENEHLKNNLFILCENPKEIFFSIMNKFFHQESYLKYIADTAVVNTESLGEGVFIGENSFISKGAIIGDNVVIKNNVSIEGKVIIGDNTIIHSGVIIGTDGFGYYQDKDGKNIKVPHYGGVIIGKDVEIGANTCIDRGTLDDTIIGDNVKIDNLCHIGHNCIIKGNSSVIALSMLGGSAILENNSYLAPGVMIMNQLKIGENSLVGMGAVVVKDVEDNKIVAGVPAKVIRDKL